MRKPLILVAALFTLPGLGCLDREGLDTTPGPDDGGGQMRGSTGGAAGAKGSGGSGGVGGSSSGVGGSATGVGGSASGVGGSGGVGGRVGGVGGSKGAGGQGTGGEGTGGGKGTGGSKGVGGNVGGTGGNSGSGGQSGGGGIKDGGVGGSCGAVCNIYCPWGNVPDASGCPTCACNPAPACATTDCPPPPPFSQPLCPDGTLVPAACTRTTDNTCQWNGPYCANIVCPILNCPLLLCPAGLKVDANDCSTCQCNPPQPPANCPPIACLIGCAYGDRKDANGCDTCDCLAAGDCQVDTDYDTCQQDQRCSWLAPGCGTPALATEGCYANADLHCTTDSACTDGRHCLQRSVNPCFSPGGGSTCDACGATLALCL